ncbi:MAG TPA: glycerate kinase [Nitrospiraceae bacterium]|nr:glycerate kinase [Nitrospiraceae bacterium]
MRIGLSHARARTIFARLFKAALEAVDPYRAVLRDTRMRRGALLVGPHRYRLSKYRRIVVIGAGKASARMAQGLEHVLGPKIDGGLVVVKYGHRLPTRTVRVVEAAHPVPDRAGLEAGRQLLDLAGTLTGGDLLIVLLSGGASSLLPVPAPGLSLEDKQATTQLLLRSGATIQEVNTVRKHVSSFKGGRLAAATKASVVTLVLSDVIGDDLGSIGSGPTAPDDTTFGEAWAIVRRYRLDAAIPRAVRRHLLQGMHGRREETPTSGSTVFARVRHHVIGSNRVALEAASKAAVRSGLCTMVASSTLTGEAREVAKVFGAVSREIAHYGRPMRRPCCFLAGGELTVTVSGHGRGGRAQEFSLAAVPEIAGLKRVWIAGFATDGSDGPTDVAGAVVGGDTAARSMRHKVDPARALLGNDAYTFFDRAGGHIKTGPTGTNVNDLYFLLAL